VDIFKGRVCGDTCGAILSIAIFDTNLHNVVLTIRQYVLANAGWIYLQTLEDVFLKLAEEEEISREKRRASKSVAATVCYMSWWQHILYTA